MTTEPIEQEPFEESTITVEEPTYKHSPRLDKFFAAMAKAQLQMKALEKNKKASIVSDKAQYSYTYPDLAAVLDACGDPLFQNEICILQPPAVRFTTRLVNDRGQQSEQWITQVTATTILGHSSGQWMSCDVTLSTSITTPQASGILITFARRYGLQAFVALAAQDSDAVEMGHTNMKDIDAAAREQEKPVPVNPEKQAMMQEITDEYTGYAALSRQKAALMVKLGKEPGLAKYYEVLSLSHGAKHMIDLKGPLEMRIAAGRLFDVSDALPWPEGYDPTTMKPDPKDALGIMLAGCTNQARFLKEILPPLRKELKDLTGADLTWDSLKNRFKINEPDDMKKMDVPERRTFVTAVYNELLSTRQMFRQSEPDDNDAKEPEEDHNEATANK